MVAWAPGRTKADAGPSFTGFALQVQLPRQPAAQPGQLVNPSQRAGGAAFFAGPRPADGEGFLFGASANSFVTADGITVTNNAMRALAVRPRHEVTLRTAKLRLPIAFGQ